MTRTAFILGKLVWHSALLVFLTLLTQVGGLAYAATLLIGRFRRNRRGTMLIIFASLYALFSVAAALTAPLTGRTPLPCFPSAQSSIAMQSPLYCALNRQYVTPGLKEIALDLADHMNGRFPGTVTLALDASFPLFDGFPLLPHLSHHDGRKLDLAFYYRDQKGKYLPGKTASPIGYWGFQEPGPGSAQPCSSRTGWRTLRWDMGWFRPFVRDYDLEPDRTRAALEWLATSGRSAGISKILIELHLSRRLKVQSDIIRFQGCHAARHDDHIHIQVQKN